MKSIRIKDLVLDGVIFSRDELVGKFLDALGLGNDDPFGSPLIKEDFLVWKEIGIDGQSEIFLCMGSLDLPAFLEGWRNPIAECPCDKQVVVFKSPRGKFYAGQYHKAIDRFTAPGVDIPRAFVICWLPAELGSCHWETFGGKQ